jgi:hypothetical protein
MNRFRRPSSRLFVLLSMLLLGALPLLGQNSTGNIYGVVLDQSGQPLPGVTVTSESGGLRNTFVTETDGAYRFLRLPPGRYTVTASLEGLGNTARTVDVNIGANSTVDLRLSPQVSETMTVTAEAPMIDTRETRTGGTITQTEIEQLPTARDPWVMLQMVPGVLVDRVNVGGNKSGQQSYFVAKGVERHQTAWNIDGVNVTEMDETGTTTFYYDFGSLQEFQVTTATSDPSVRTPGVQINMVTKRGTNELSGSARAVWADESLQAEATMPDTLRAGNRVDNVTELGGDLGGPIIRDKLWFFGAYSQNEIANIISVYNYPQRTELTNWTAKLSAQPLSNNNASLYYMFSDKTVNARDLSASRPPETARKQTGPGWTLKVEDTHVFSNNFVVTAVGSHVDGGYRQEPLGGMDIEPWWVGSNLVLGPDGEPAARGWHDTYRLSEQSLEQNNLRADASAFFQGGNMAHEIKFGGGYRDQDTEWVVTWPGQGYWTEYYRRRSGALWQLVALTRDAHPLYTGRYYDLYAGDTFTAGNLTVTAGARYDKQQVFNTASDVPANPLVPNLIVATSYPGDEQKLTWESVMPKVSAAYTLGSDRRTVVRAAYNRYADQLGTSDAGANNPFYDYSVLYYYWEDGNGDRRVQTGEIDFDSGVYSAVGIDPDNLAAGAPSVGRIDYDNHNPTTTDEILLGVEREIVPGWVVGVNYTQRVRENFLWNQFEKTRGGGDFYTAADYELGGNATAIMPDGEQITVPYYQLRAGIDDPLYYATRNRPDYKQNYKGFELTAQRRMSGRWMMRGQLTLGDWTQDVGEGAIQDPSPILEGDSCVTCDGAAVASSSGLDGYINAEWSYSLSGLYSAPWGINLGGVVTGRQGYINGYSIYPDGRVDGINKQLTIGSFDEYRFDDLFQLDLKVGKEFQIRNGLGFEVSVDVFNATNERTILWRGSEIVPQFDEDEETLIRTPETDIEEMQSPRLVRLSGRLRF